MKMLLSAVFVLATTLSGYGQLWSDNYTDAQQTAAETGKSVVVVFSGSDWCAPCIKLEREIWSDATFQKDAAEQFVFYRADFPRKKENSLPEELAAQNADLAERYNSRGSFPLVVILTPQGDVLGEAGYKKVSPAEYLQLLQGFAG